MLLKIAIYFLMMTSDFAHSANLNSQNCHFILRPSLTSVSDDVQINQAFNQCATQYSGGVVELLAGFYLLKNPLVIPKTSNRIILQGYRGAIPSLLWDPNSPIESLTLLSSGGSAVVLRNLYLRVSGADLNHRPANQVIGVDLKDSKNSELENISIDINAKISVGLKSVFKELTLSHNRYKKVFVSCHFSKVPNDNLYFQSSVGISLENSNQNQFIGGHLQSCIIGLNLDHSSDNRLIGTQVESIKTAVTNLVNSSNRNSFEFGYLEAGYNPVLVSTFDKTINYEAQSRCNLFVLSNFSSVNLLGTSADSQTMRAVKAGDARLYRTEPAQVFPQIFNRCY